MRALKLEKRGKFSEFWWKLTDFGTLTPQKSIFKCQFLSKTRKSIVTHYLGPFIPIWNHFCDHKIKLLWKNGDKFDKFRPFSSFNLHVENTVPSSTWTYLIWFFWLQQIVLSISFNGYHTLCDIIAHICWAGGAIVVRHPV